MSVGEFDEVLGMGPAFATVRQDDRLVLRRESEEAFAVLADLVPVVRGVDLDAHTLLVRQQVVDLAEASLNERVENRPEEEIVVRLEVGDGFVVAREHVAAVRDDGGN